MFEIDLNEQFIIYAIYNGEGKWYISDKEIWYLDYKKRIEEYKLLYIRCFFVNAYGYVDLQHKKEKYK